MNSTSKFSKLSIWRKSNWQKKHLEKIKVILMVIENGLIKSPSMRKLYTELPYFFLSWQDIGKKMKWEVGINSNKKEGDEEKKLWKWIHKINLTKRELDRIRRVGKVLYERTVNVLWGKDNMMCYTFFSMCCSGEDKKNPTNVRQENIFSPLVSRRLKAHVT